MSLLRTLTCAEGQDNPIRLVVIQAVTIALLLMVLGLFFNTSLQQGSVALVALIATPLSWLSAKRRLRQAQRPNGLAWLLAGAWILFAISHFVFPTFAWWTLILPIAATAVLAMLPSKSKGGQTVLGYCGPVNHNNAALARSRVEPSMVAADTAATITHDWDERPNSGITIKAIDINGAVDFCKRNSRTVVIGVSALVLLVLVAFLFSRGGNDNDTDNGVNSQTAAVEKADNQSTGASPKLDAVVALPDSFQVGLQRNSLVITWPGDPVEHGQLWDQLAAEGDTSCAEARFNNNDSFRPIKVEVWQDDIYYAYFSALDTKAMVYDVAMRGSFSLCGYQFSLSGSMKPLKSHPAFAPLLDK